MSAEPHQNEPIEEMTENVKSSDKAREAFEQRDATASRQEHDKLIVHGKEKHSSGASDYVKGLVFGALDGICTTFAVVSAAQGAGDTIGDVAKVVLVMGFSNVVADGFSMGFGEFIGSTAEIDHMHAERAREEWEVEEYLEGEKREMVELYQSKGLSEEDAQTIVNIISKDKKVFVDIMMVEELGLMPVDEDDKYGPLKSGLVMFTAFICFGILPILPYTGGRADGMIFGISCAVTAVALFVLGVLKGLLTSQNKLKTGLIMVVNGGISAGMSYAIGTLADYIATK